MLITLLDWLGRMLNVNRRSHVIGHVMTLWIFGAPKSCAFGEITKRCLIDSTAWVRSMGVVTQEDHVRWSWKWVSPRWLRVRRSDGKKGKLTLWSFKYRCQLIVRLKAIKFIKELLCFLSSYINLQSSDLYSPRSIGIMMIKAFGLIVDCLMGWGWSSLPSLSIWFLSVWSIPKAIHFTYKLLVWVIGVAIETRYCSYRSDFHKSDLSPWEFTSFMNCMLGSTIHLDSNSVITGGLSSPKSRFICYFRIGTLLRGIVLQ